MKTYINSFLKIVIGLLPLLSLSQNLPEVLPPSPTVANLMQFEEVPISYYTGQPNISIPIYSKAISGDLSLNIGLSYNTQSIKVNNRSGWTGTGWSLNAGGSISRTVRGLPDEMKRNTSTIIGEGVLHNDDFWNYENLTVSEQERFQWRVAGTPAHRYDNQHDLFQFNFIGFSGRFIIMKEGNTLVAKNLDKSQNLKIDIQYNDDPLSNDYYKLLAFKITDTRGYKYTFDVIEATSYQPFIATEFHNNDQVISGQDQHYISNSAWHISKIEMPNSVNENLILASFNYSPSFEAYTTSIQRTYTNPILNHHIDLYNWNEHIRSNSYNASIMKPKESHSFLTIGVDTKKIQSISFRDGTSVHFEMSSEDHPETNGDILEYIRIFNNGADTSNPNEENKHFKLNYDIGNRLWLKQIDEVTGSETNVYNFNYNNKELLAPFDSPNNTDDWGYYKENTLEHCSLVQPDANTITTGLLNQIIYPTGGATEFEFEPHQISYQGQHQLTDNQYRDMNPDNWITRQVNATYYNSFGSPNPSAPSFTLSQEQELSLNILSLSGDENDIFNTNVQIWDSNNNTVQSFALDRPQTFRLDAGAYTVHFITPSISPNITTEVCVGYKDFHTEVKRYIYGGGVRIKSVKFKDNPDKDTIAKVFNYGYKDNIDVSKSSGSIDGLLTGLLREYNETVTRIIPINAPCARTTVSMSFDFAVKTQGLNVELTKNQYVGYKTVSMYQHGNGKTKYTYTSAQDYYSPSATFDYPYPPAEDIDYKRGLILKVETFDFDNKLVKQIENSYSHEEDIISKNYVLHEEDCKWKIFYQYYDNWLFETPTNKLNQCELNFGNCGNECYTIMYDTCNLYNDITPETMYIYENVPNKTPYQYFSNNLKSTWTKLNETISKDYFYSSTGTQSVKETRQVFTYNDDNYQVKTQDTYYKVKGVDEHLKVQYNYPVGPYTANNTENTGGIRSKLAAQNKVTEILETQSYRNGVMISETHNIYEDFDTSSNDLMLPKEIKVGKNGSIPENRIEFLKYDSYGNPTEVKKTDGTSIIYVYGFNGSVPVAKITNGNYSSVQSALGGNTNLAGNTTPSQETSLRLALPDAMLSFYRYDPLKGVISTLDDKGYTTTYEYDAFNRLVRVKDAQGNILVENTYHYKNQQ